MAGAGQCGGRAGGVQRQAGGTGGAGPARPAAVSLPAGCPLRPGCRSSRCAELRTVAGAKPSAVAGEGKGWRLETLPAPRLGFLWWGCGQVCRLCPRPVSPSSSTSSGKGFCIADSRPSFAPAFAAVSDKRSLLPWPGGPVLLGQEADLGRWFLDPVRTSGGLTSFR